MKQIKFYELPEMLRPYLQVTFDGDKTDLRLHSDEFYRWGAKTKKLYQKAEEAINKIEYKGNGWEIYAGYDVSGYDYWMKQMEETNYVHITISFTEETINESEIEPLKVALCEAFAKADAIQEIYNYDPNNKKQKV